jgi:hypothetical protein
MIEHYDIRIEYGKDAHEDVVIPATNLAQARIAAEIRVEAMTGEQHQYDWRGQVVFVDHSP